MYQYDEYDRALVRERVAQFRDQIERRLSGELSEEEFLPLRLQNGLYMQKHAYMLRVAIPYGTLSARQLRTLAGIARDYDRDYGHFTTRQNIQFNWIELEQVGDILERLAEVEMHAIQTSGNCVRNITTEAFAGVAADELLDPRPLAEILRQWSTVNPEFLYLPRKFKIALCAAQEDRAAVMMHDIGLYLYRDAAGELLLRVMVGGGLGRTPILGQQIREGLPWQHLLSYVEAEWQQIKDGPAELTAAEYQRVAAAFVAPPYASLDDADLAYGSALARDPGFARWVSRNVRPHRVAGYASVVLSTKPATDSPPGDVTSAQMHAIADLAEDYGFGEIRIAHEQNVVLPDVPKADLHALHQRALSHGLGTANIGLLTDMIVCPGGDYCALANAKSIPIAQSIQQRFADQDALHRLGELSLNISGCINACGHHHIGNIGILGVDKNGSEWYQVTIGGAQGKASALGKVIGPAFSATEIPAVIEGLVKTFSDYREVDERFVDTVQRIGLEPFREQVYRKTQVPA